MLKEIGRSKRVQHALGALLAGYLKLVRATSRISIVGDADAGALDACAPAIVTFWHGQHLMQSFGLRPHDRFSVMISRSGDGEINAHAVELLGATAVRGSGSQRRDQIGKRGGIQALRKMLSLLEAGEHVAMTADVPKVSRVAGEGIITLAQLSGRPILPAAVVASRRFDFKSWDAASIGLPFSRVAVVIGTPIRVARSADAPEREAARLALQSELDRIYAQGYASFSQRDPGADRASMIEARALQAAKALDVEKPTKTPAKTPLPPSPGPEEA